MKEEDIRSGATYAGKGWKTPRKVEAIEKPSGTWSHQEVVYTRVGGKNGRVRKSLMHFAFEARSEIQTKP